MTTRRITVCGGTSLGHALAAVLGADPANEVRVWTRQPERWSPRVRAIYLDIAEIRGDLTTITNDVRTAVADTDMVFVCTPLPACAELLGAMAGSLPDRAWIGGVPGFGGFDRSALSLLGRPERIFGLQRVPYVRKTISYGETVWISGIRPRLYLATLAGDAEKPAKLVEALLGIPTTPLAGYISVALSPSNAIFHPARLMTAFPAPGFSAALERGDQFYEHWDDDASTAYLALDTDIQAIARARQVRAGEVEPIADHFGITTPAQLTARIRRIRALRDRRLPIRGAARQLDLESHFMTEDAWFALPALAALAREAGVPTPAVDQAMTWASTAAASRKKDPVLLQQ